MLLDELHRVEQELAALERAEAGSEGSSAEVLQDRLKELRARLRQLGPVPKAMMG